MTNDPSSGDFSRREFVVLLGGATLGSFFLPNAFGGGAAAESGGLAEKCRRIMTKPQKLPYGPGGFSLLWTEVNDDDEATAMIWSPETEEEITEARRFYDAARNFNPHAAQGPSLLDSPPPQRSPEEERFLQRIRANLSAVGPRLEYAKWLRRRDDPLGEFIEIDCLLEDISESDPRWEKNNDRWSALLEKHEKEWLQPLLEMGLSPEIMSYWPTGMWYSYGFVQELDIDKPGILPERADWLFYAAPILHRLEFSYDELDIVAIVNVPQMEQVTSLDLGAVDMDLEMLEALSTSKHLKKLRELELGNIKLDAEAAKFLARSPVIARLRSLDLSQCSFRGAGAEVLLSSSSLANLESLDLHYTKLDAEDVERLAQSPHMARLKRLSLESNDIGKEGLRALSTSPHLPKLESLRLGYCNIGGEEIAPLISSPLLARLKTLKISANQLDNQALAKLANSEGLQGLAVLDLSLNDFDHVGAQALADSPHASSLEELDLSNCDIGPQGALALGNSPHLLRTLKRLDVRSCGLGEEGARILAEAPTFAKLESLQAKRGDIGRVGAELLEKRFDEETLSLLGDYDDDNDDDE